MWIFGFKIKELNGNGENYIMRGLMICTVQLNCSVVKIEKRKSVFVERRRVNMGFGIGILEQNRTNLSLSLFMAVWRVTGKWCEDNSC